MISLTVAESDELIAQYSELKKVYDEQRWNLEKESDKKFEESSQYYKEQKQVIYQKSKSDSTLSASEINTMLTNLFFEFVEKQDGIKIEFDSRLQALDAMFGEKFEQIDKEFKSNDTTVKNLDPFLDNISSQSVEIPEWIKNNVKNFSIQNNSNQNIISLLENLSNIGIIKNIWHTQMQIYVIPPKGKVDFVHLSGNVNEYGKSGSVLLEINKPDNTKEILSTPILETGFYSTVFPINTQSQKGTYQVISEFNGNQLSVKYFSIAENDSKRIPSWFVTLFQWWVDDKITDTEFIQSIQYLVDNKILVVFVNSQITPDLKVSVDGQQLVRRGTTHTITTHISYGEQPVKGAKVTLTIEDYDENIIREFNGFSDNSGEFIFSWEIPKKFDDLKTLLTYVSVTYNDSSVTKLFKFQVYCLPGESNCKIDGNR